ncbi:MAG: alpha-mannosidase [Candidatus Ranarchaeia archaeon]
MESDNEQVCYFLGHSHIDAAWLWRIDETKKVLRETWDRVVKLMDSYSDLVFCQSSAQYYEWLEKEYPETFSAVRKKIREGRWEIVGGTWIEPDCNMPSGESLVRQFLYGKKYFQLKFEKDITVAWLPDSFGFAWTLPQIMLKAGMKYFLTQKMNWNDTTVFPYYVFSWVGPDGSSILSHQTVGSYHETGTDKRINRQMEMLYDKQKMKSLFYLIGVGDHGGGLTAEIVKRALNYVVGKKPIKGKFITAKYYFRKLPSIIKDIPVINDELYLQFHRGTYTTQGKTKFLNRKLESALERAEKLSSLAFLLGLRYPTKELERAWKKLLLNQFHDILSGSSISDVYVDAIKDFNTALSILDDVITAALKKVAEQVDTTGDGRPLLIFNVLSWKRDGIVKLDVNEFSTPISIYDEKGRLVPCQVDPEAQQVIFLAKDVPSVGYKLYFMKQVKKPLDNADLSCESFNDAFVIQNYAFKVKVDKKTGLISIFDKINQKDVLSKPGNLIQIFEDYPMKGRKTIPYTVDASKFDAWELYIYEQPDGLKCTELRKPVSVVLCDRGPVKASVKVRYHYEQNGRQTSTFEQEIILYRRLPLIVFTLKIDWNAVHRLVKVAFPLNINNDFATYEIPYGYIMRRNPISVNASSAERAKYEVPAQKWVDLTDKDGNYGVSLLNDCKYGFDVAGNTIRMSILRSATYPTELRKDYGLPYKDKKDDFSDQGIHVLSYALYPHRSDFKDALTVRRGYEFNLPLIPYITTPHKGVLPKHHSFVSLDSKNVMLTVMKKAESTDDIIFRFYEINGSTARVNLAINLPLTEIEETDLLERKTSSLDKKEGKTLSFSPYEIKTVKLTKLPHQLNKQA